jgi:hypothetical protein
LFAIALTSLIACAAVPCIAAQFNDRNLNEAEQWAWSRISNGQPADFDDGHCHDQLDPKRDDGGIASQKCRTLRATFLEDILKQPPLRDALPDNGVDVRGAKIVGDVRLSFATLKHPLRITNSRFEGGIFLDDARAERFVDLSGSSVSGAVNANALQVDGAVHMRSDKAQSSFQDVSLIGAKVAGDLDMVAVRVDGDWNAHGLQVGGSLVFRSDAENGRQASVSGAKSGTAIDLTSAKVAGNVDMDGVSVNGPFDAANLQVGESLLMRPIGKHVATLHQIFLGGAKIDGSLDMTGALVTGNLDATSAHVGGSLNMKGASLTEVLLPFAKVDGNLDMTGARVTTKVDAPSLHVGESLVMRSDQEHVASLGDVSLGNAKIDNLLDLTGARAENLDAPLLRVGGNLKLDRAEIAAVNLEAASIDGQIRVGAENAPAKIEEIDLRNARAGSLLDGGEDSWPRKLRLDGFTFSRFGRPDMVRRSHEWWDNWARTDKDSSAYPYEQLAAAHAAAGNRDAADDFHFYERVRAGESESAGLLERAGSYVQRWGAGYGIGYYMFRALYWALGLALLGAILLRFWVRGVAAKHGIFWCFGASANRLLPFITLKKEFTEFFDNREVNGFTRGQDLFFTVFAVLGWVLGAIVLAAMGTFTKGS